jgi:hypothetical protein
MPTTASTIQHTAEYVTLRDYIDTQMEARDRALNVALANLDRRLDGMNEFRDALRDQGFTFLTKAEYGVFKERLELDIRGLRESRSLLEGKADQKQVNTALILSIIGLILGVIGLMMRLI